MRFILDQEANLDLQISNRSKYSWNPAWISEYESSWSIFEKFKKANSASSRDVLDIFGTDAIKKMKGRIGSSKRNLYELGGINDEIAQAELGLSLVHRHNQHLMTLCGFLHSERNEIITFFRDFLCYCPECILQGFHSIWHQFKLVNLCPIHMIPLVSSCSVCGKVTRYELSQKSDSYAYTCECGFQFGGHSFSVFKKQTFDQSIQCDLVYEWIQLSDNERNILSRTYLFKEVDYDNFPNFMDFLLSIAKKKYNRSDEPNFQVAKSSRNMWKLKSTLDFPFFKSISIDYKWRPLTYIGVTSHSPQITAIQKELFASCKATIKGLAKYIRKLQLTKHKSCIRRLVRVSSEPQELSPAICPFAFAYVRWREWVEGFEHFYDVDNFRGPYRNSKGKFDFATTKDNDIIIEILNLILSHFPLKDPEQLAYIKWIVNRIVAHIVLGHFYMWLSLASNPDFSAIVPETHHIKYKKVDMFALCLPKKEGETFEFHWMHNHNNSLKNITLVCPFPSVKKRRKTASVVSHHPLKIAIDKKWYVAGDKDELHKNFQM